VTSGSLEQVDAMSLQPEQQPFGPGVEDFFLMDVVGGGCAEQSGGTLASKCVAVLHPTKPVVAYSAGCMIIVYDLMSDSKVNLVGHQHDVHAIAFTPSGDTLMSVDFNRNAELQDNLNT
jgi:WD40 repeat protein